MGSPFSGGLGGPAFGQAEVPDLLPSRPLQGPGQFLTSPESSGLDLQARSGAGSNVVLDMTGYITNVSVWVPDQPQAPGLIWTH